MEVAGLVFGVLPTIEMCARFIKFVIQIRDTFKNANKEIYARCNKLENVLVQFQLQLDLIYKIWTALDESHQRLHNDNTERLRENLSRVFSKIENFTKRNKASEGTKAGEASIINPYKYVVWKKGLDKALKDLTDYKQIFDSTWFLMTMVSDSKVDISLTATESTAMKSQHSVLRTASQIRAVIRSDSKSQSHMYRPRKDIDWAQSEPIRFSTAVLARHTRVKRLMIVESAPCLSYNTQDAFIDDARTLGQKLHDVDLSNFGLLRCFSLIKDTSIMDLHNSTLKSISFTFEIPDKFIPSTPQSLRKILLAGTWDEQIPHSLSERFRLARELSIAVLCIHILGFVHKDIRPETILLLSEEKLSLGKLFLVGLQDFRTADGLTRLGDYSSWYKNLYRHPDRQGESPRETYIMQHDVYSLGVCLLEIGLFKSFIEYSEVEQVKEPRPLQALTQDISGFPKSHDPRATKTHLLSLARTQLPSLMGDQYAHIVETCLTCLDPDNEDFGDEKDLREEGGVSVSVRYVEKVLSELSKIFV